MFRVERWSNFWIQRSSCQCSTAYDFVMEKFCEYNTNDDLWILSKTLVHSLCPPELMYKKFLPSEEFSLLKFSIPSLSSAAFWFPTWAISVSIVVQSRYHIHKFSEMEGGGGPGDKKKERWKKETENSVNWSWSQTERWPRALCLNLWVCVTGRVLIVKCICIIKYCKVHIAGYYLNLGLCVSCKITWVKQGFEKCKSIMWTRDHLCLAKLKTAPADR